MLTKTLLNSAITGILLATLTACGESTEALQTPATSTTASNNNLISQKNLSMVFSDVQPAFVDLATGLFTEVTSDVIIRIGDNNNQLITATQTIFFQTEWGLIPPSCETDEEGTCTVTWRSGNPSDMPFNFRNTIVAYSLNGQESFLDLDGNNRFNDGDTFTDIEEPYIDNNESGVFDAGDKIIDTINGVDLSGANALHDTEDGKYNGPNCSHSTDCSTTRTVSAVWTDGALLLTGSEQYTVGGSISGLAGNVVIQLNGDETLTLNSNDDFTFTKTGFPGSTYAVTVLTQPPNRTCTVTKNATGTIGRNSSGGLQIGGNVTDIEIVCI